MKESFDLVRHRKIDESLKLRRRKDDPVLTGSTITKAAVNTTALLPPLSLVRLPEYFVKLMKKAIICNHGNGN